MLFTYLLAFFCLFTTTYAEEEECGLFCFLENLEVNIDLNMTVSGIIILTNDDDIELSQGTLHGIKLDSIDGWTETEDPQTFTLYVKIAEAFVDGDIVDPYEYTKVIGDFHIALYDAWIQLTLGFVTENFQGYDLIKETDVSLDFDLNLNSAEVSLSYNDNANIWQKSTIGGADVLVNIITGLGDLVGGIIKTQLDSLNELIEGLLDDLFGMLTENYVKVYINGTDPLTIPIDSYSMTNLTESSIFDLVNWLTTDLLSGNSDLGLNNLINRFTDNTGNITIGTRGNDTDSELSQMVLEFLNFEIDVPDLNATISLALDYLKVTGLNTWHDIHLFQPLRSVNISDSSSVSTCDIIPECDYQLRIASGLRNLTIDITFEINATANGTSINTNGATITEKANFYVDVSENYMDGRIQIAIENGLLELYSNKMCTNITCWLALIEEGTGIPFLSLTTSVNDIEMSAASDDLEQGIQNVINSLVDVFLNKYRAAIPALLNGFINIEGTTLINDMLNGTLNATCDDDPDEIYKEYSPTILAVSLTSSFLITAVLVAIAVLFFVITWRAKRAVDDSTETTESDTNEEKNFKTDPKGASVFLDHRVNIVIRVLIPFFIMVTFVIFLISNTGTGATVDAYISLGNGKVISMQVQEFNLMGSVTDMWTAGVYPLAILIFVFSGFWPYLKLVALMLCWVIPSSILPGKIRGIVLTVLDVLGKWSMLDSYVMVLMIVAFYMNIPLPIENADSVDDPVLVNLFVYPAFGFVTLLMGTIMALLLSHVQVIVNNILLRNKTDNLGAEANKWRPLCWYARFWVTRIVVPICVSVVFILVVIGMFITSFSFDFYGLAGWALDTLGYGTHRQFSVFDLGTDLPESTREPNSFAVRFTQIVYFLTIVCMPFIHLVSLMLLWLVPLRRRFQSLLYHACDIFYAWSSIDVFVISVIGAIVELQQFAQFMVEPMCGAKIDGLGMTLDEIIAQYFGNEEGIEGHETCFDVSANLEGGCWLLFVAVILYTITTISFMVISKRALKKRLPTKEELEEIKQKENEVEMSEKLVEGSEHQSVVDEDDNKSLHEPEEEFVNEHSDVSPQTSENHSQAHLSLTDSDSQSEQDLVDNTIQTQDKIEV
ncbi:Uncharacterized protein QTN25_003494 [Entamoeba marina]